MRSAAFQVAFLSAAGVAARMGTAQIAAHQIGLQLWEFTALLLDSFAIAAQSLVGAALGGSDAAGARAMAWQVARWGTYAGVTLAAIFARPAGRLSRACSARRAPCIEQAHVLWPWFVVMLPAAGLVFALDGVLIGAGDVAFLRTITLIAGVFAFAPLSIAALHWHWGIGGVWAGLTAFILVRLVGMVARTRGDRWVVLGEDAMKRRLRSEPWAQKSFGGRTERSEGRTMSDACGANNACRRPSVAEPSMRSEVGHRAMGSLWLTSLTGLDLP